MPQIDADGEKDRQTHALVDAAMTGKASCRGSSYQEPVDRQAVGTTASTTLSAFICVICGLN